MHTASRLAGPVLVTVAIHAVLMGLYLRYFNGDPSGFVCLATSRLGVPPYEAITRAAGPGGHDGQFYYALARAPFQAHGADIDLPPLRHVRILYPLVCWACSGGEPHLLIYVMPAVNLLAVAGLAGLGAAWALRCGQSAWWGVLLPVGLNAGISLIHNFTDCFSSLAVVALLAAWLAGGRAWLIALLAAAALFSREQNAFVVVVVAAFALARGRRYAALGAAAALVAWAGWVGLLWATYGHPPWVTGDQNIAFPFRGVVFRVWHLGDVGDLGQRFSTRLALVQGLGLLYLLLTLGLAVWMLRWPVGGEVRVLAAGGVLLAVVTGVGPYSDFASYLRVFAWVPIALYFGSLAAGRCWPLRLMAPALLCSLGATLRWA